ncbi:hypothetical protein JCM3774_000251 [Rhodotorula dairenensis]
MSPPPRASSIAATSTGQPVASTSRIPYTVQSASPAATGRRCFSSSSATSSSSRTRSRAHWIHPMARQRLTNLTFLSAGLLSVLTVSLTMSGTFGEGAAPGCPARVRTGVALDEESEDNGQREHRAAQAATAADIIDGKRKWWETSKAKGRFLEDPVVSAAAKPPVATGQDSPRVSSRRGAASDLEAQTHEPESVTAACSSSSREERIRDAPCDWRSGWKGIRDPEERVV